VALHKIVDSVAKHIARLMKAVDRPNSTAASAHTTDLAAGESS
jgi:hypothetical protein